MYIIVQHLEFSWKLNTVCDCLVVEFQNNSYSICNEEEIVGEKGLILCASITVRVTNFNIIFLSV